MRATLRASSIGSSFVSGRRPTAGSRAAGELNFNGRRVAAFAAKGMVKVGSLPARCWSSQDAVRALIRDDKPHEIRNALVSGKQEGSQTLESDLMRLVNANVVDIEVARRAAIRPERSSPRRCDERFRCPIGCDGPKRRRSTGITRRRLRLLDNAQWMLRLRFVRYAYVATKRPGRARYRRDLGGFASYGVSESFGAPRPHRLFIA